MPLDWDAPVRAAWALNYKRFSMPEADQAIRTFMLKTGMPRKAVEDKIRTDDMFRWCFVKDPKKQNIYRDLAASYIRSIPQVTSFVRLKAGERLICGGTVMSREEAKKRGANPSPKPIDFQWKTGKHTVYASHKYTKESGGAQGKQYHELHSFIDDANHSNLKATAFIAIADGPHYDSTDSIRGKTRIESLRQACNRTSVFACRMEELQGILARLPP